MDKIWKLKQWKIEINSKKLIFKSNISWKFMNSFKNIEKDILWWKLMIFETLTSWMPEKIFIYENWTDSMYFSLNRTTGKVTKLDIYENTNENRLELISSEEQYEKQWMIWVLKICSEYTKFSPAYDKRKVIDSIFQSIPAIQEIFESSNENWNKYTITDMIQLKNKKIAIFSEHKKEDSFDSTSSVLKLIDISNKTSVISMIDQLDWLTIMYINEQWKSTSILNNIRDKLYPFMYDLIKLTKDDSIDNNLKIKWQIDYLTKELTWLEFKVPDITRQKNNISLFSSKKLLDFSPEPFLILSKFMEWLINQYTHNSEISDYFILKLFSLRSQDTDWLTELLRSYKTSNEWCVLEAVSDEWFKNIWKNRKWKKISFCWDNEWVDITKDIVPLRKFIETNQQSDFLNNFFQKKN